MPPFVLITGPEGVLAERALAAMVALAREADPEAEKITVRATAYEPGVLALHASPSLFGGSKVVVAEDVDEASDDLVTDLLHYIAAPAPDLMLVVMHKSGVRGKKVLDAMKAVGARVIECPAIKNDRDKTDFVTHEFRRHGRRATPEAVHAALVALRDTTPGLVCSTIRSRLPRHRQRDRPGAHRRRPGIAAAHLGQGGVGRSWIIGRRGQTGGLGALAGRQGAARGRRLGRPEPRHRNPGGRGS